MNITDPATEENPTIEVVSPTWSDSLNASNLKDLNTRGYLSYKLAEKLVLLTLNTVPYSVSFRSALNHVSFSRITNLLDCAAEAHARHIE